MFGWFCCCASFEDETETVQATVAYKPRWKSSAVSLRGHLVRTYNIDIERDYYIDRDHELGKGGCGVVVVGEHKETRQQYAIKIVNKATAERGRLDRELKLMKDVDHANIVRLFSVYDVPGNMYFVMELCLGGHLGNLLSRQPQKFIDEDWAKNLARQLLSAVAHIHSRGIAHRDIKLQNILIDSTNDRFAQLKLIDFGYGSRFIGALPMRTKCGTPYTTAPEVIRECYDERCDIWSCGVVLYIMLCGRRPFEALDIAGPLSDAGKAAMITNILAGRFHFNHKPWQRVSKVGLALVKMLLHQDYRTRIRAYEALENAWFDDTKVVNTQTSALISAKSFRAINNIRRSSFITDMQRTGMIALVFGINARTAVDLRSVFQSFDRDGSGTISKEEFVSALKSLTPELTSEDIDRLFDIVDIDHSQTISYTEFLAATLDPREVDIEELSKAFKLLDEDGNGFITKDELRKVVKVMIEQTRSNDSIASPSQRSMREEFLSGVLDEDVDAKVQEIFAQVDVNGDGKISHEEFFWAMTGMNSVHSTVPTPSSNQMEETTSGKMARTSSMSSRNRTNSYSHQNSEQDQPAVPYRHSIGAIRMSSSKRIINTVVEASEASSSQHNVEQTVDPLLNMSMSSPSKLPSFSGMLARGTSHLYEEGHMLPSNGDFLRETSKSSPRPGENIVFYHPHSDEPGEHSSTKGNDGQHDADSDGDGVDPSSSECSSYDTKKVRTLFGAGSPHVVPFSSPPFLSSGSKKILLPPISRKANEFDQSQGSFPFIYPYCCSSHCAIRWRGEKRSQGVRTDALYAWEHAGQFWHFFAHLGPSVQ